MLDFHRHARSPRPSRFGPDQRRLGGVILALALVMVASSQVGDPRAWRWFANFDTGPDQASAAAVVTPLPPEMAGVPAVDLVGDGKLGDGRLSGLDTSAWVEIEDDAAFSSSDMGPFFEALDAVGRTPSARLRAHSVGSLAYVQLFNQPDEYRGKVVTVAGRVRRAHRLAAPANRFGIDHYHELFIETSDRSMPIVVYSRELPAGFPEGMTLDEPAVVDGIFFKRWVYLAGDGLRSAPLLLARTVAWRPQATEAIAKEDRGGPRLIVILLLGAAGAWWWMRRSASPKRVEFRLPSEETHPPTAIEVAATLRQLDSGARG